MEGSRTHATFDVNALDPEELALWRESEQEFDERVRASLHGRADSSAAHTENQLSETLGMLHALHAKKTQPAICRGDLSGVRPAIKAESGFCAGEDADAYGDWGKLAGVGAAIPRTDELTMLSDAELDACTDGPFSLICVTPLPPSGRTAIDQTDKLLRRLWLSGTEHASVDDFVRAVTAPDNARIDGCRVLFGVYDVCGVVCRLVPETWALRDYAFVGKWLQRRTQ